MQIGSGKVIKVAQSLTIIDSLSVNLLGHY